MDRIGDANKPIEARMAEVREEKKVVHVPKDALNSGVDTSEYLKEQLSLGLDYMFNLSTPVLPGDEAPLFEAPSLEKGVSKVTNLSELKGRVVLLVFYPKDMSIESEETMNLLTDMALAPELDLQLLTISTDTIETHRAWSEQREGGTPPVIMLSDKNGHIAQMYGVLDSNNHVAFQSVFLIDPEGVVQGSRVAGRGGLQPNTASDMLDFIRAALKPQDQVE